MAISLSNLLDEKQVTLHLPGRDPAAALDKIVRLLAENGKIDDHRKFLEQLLAREQARPSAVEHGVAFPHLRTDLADQIVLAVGRSKPGIPFDGSEPANLIFVIGVPQRLANDYLICVGTLTRLLRDEFIRAALMQTKTPAQFVGILKDACPP
jgi:mannitol/fructose-specific phosphotransferase system IIA component (Ntr-type)